MLGRSRSGKPTSLSSVAGFDHRTAVAISIGGRLVSSPADGVMVPARKRGIGMVFQSYAVWPHMTVAQNVRYPLKTRGISRSDADAQVAEVLDLVGLGDYPNRPSVSPPAGQIQRVPPPPTPAY